MSGCGGVEHHEVDPGGAADDLGRQRRAAHAAEHDPVDALALELLAQGGDLAEQRPRGAGQVDPGQPDRRLGLGVRAPQGGVLGEQLAGELGLDEVGDLGGDGIGCRAGCHHAE